MKKSITWRSVISMVLALILCVSLPVTIWAETTTETKDNGNGTKTTIHTETTTGIDEDGRTVVTTTISKETEYKDGEKPEGLIDYSKDETRVETETYDENGNVIGSSWTEDGTEITKTESENQDGNYEAGQTPVDVTLSIPGTATGEASTVVGTETSEDGKTTTTTTEIDRTVTAETSDVTFEESDEIVTDLKTPELVKKTGEGTEDYSFGNEPKPGYEHKPLNSAKAFDCVTVNGIITYFPRMDRTEAQMTDAIRSYYTYNAETGLYTPNPKSGYYSIGDRVGGYGGGEFIYTCPGEKSGYNMLLDDGWEGFYYTDSSTGELKWQDGTPSSLRISDVYGNITVTYCLDKETGTIVGHDYNIENLEDADYFVGTEEEIAVAKDHVRAIAQYGYWGASDTANEDGTLKTGSLAKVKADLKTFIENNPDFTFTYNDPGHITGEEILTESKTFNAGTDKEAVLALVDKLNYAGAVAVMNSAFWEYGRGETNPEQIFNKDVWETDPEFNYALVLLREYLLSDELVAQMKEEGKDNSSTIYDANSFLTEDGITMIVGDKSADEQFKEVNNDDLNNNDVYNVDISFTMVAEPAANDDLIISLYDGDGNLIRRARLAGEPTDEDAGFSTIEKSGSTYTFKGLTFGENSDIKFDLKLDGYQNLEQGVYIYKGTRGYDGSQTLVGLAEGTRTVDVHSSFTLNFNVDETNYIEVEKVWHDEGDPEITPDDPTPTPNDPTPTPNDPTPTPNNPTPTPNNPTPTPNDPEPTPEQPVPYSFDEEIEDEEVPLNEEPEEEEDYEEDEEIEILDEEIPLAEVPETGDASDIMMLVVIFAVVGLIVVNLPMKKRYNA